MGSPAMNAARKADLMERATRSAKAAYLSPEWFA